MKKKNNYVSVVHQEYAKNFKNYNNDYNILKKNNNFQLADLFENFLNNQK